MELFVSTHSIRNGRRKMEDKHVIIHDLNAHCNLNTQKKYSFYAVYDGHRGVDAASYCAENLHQILCKTRSFHEGNIEKALRETFRETDRLFCSSRLKTQAGCTAVVCLREIHSDPVEKMKLYFAWAGDSQAVLVRDGSAIDVTPPHKPENDEEITRIESLGGSVIKTDCYRVNGMLGVARAIGDESQKPYITAEPDIRVELLLGGEDFMILACDGLWDEIDCDDATQLVYETIQDSEDAEVAAKSVAACLVESAKNQGSSDNITAIVIFLRSLRDIFPTASFNNDPSKKVVNTKEEKTDVETLLGLEPVRLRAKKDGNIVVFQGYGEDVGVKVRIAGDSSFLVDDTFKNGSVTSTPCCEEKIDPLPQKEIINLPSPTLQYSECLDNSNAGATTTTETMNSESTSSISTSKLGEEDIPHLSSSSPLLIRSVVEPTTTTDSTSRLVTPPNISQNDLMQFSFASRPAESSQTIQGINQLPDKISAEKEMERNRINNVSMPVQSFKFESMSEDVKIEEEYEETTVTTETIFDPIPMTRTEEKVFTGPNIVTSLSHEFSSENKTNGKSPSPTKVDEEIASRESYSITTPSGKERVVRISGEFSDDVVVKDRESKRFNDANDILNQAKETKVFEIDSVVNNSPVAQPVVRVHDVVLENDQSQLSNIGQKQQDISYKKEVNRFSSMNGSRMTLESSMESSAVTTSSDVASSLLQASSNGCLNRAFLDCDSSQNLSKDEARMKDFSPNEQSTKNVNNDYLTLSGTQIGITPELNVSHDMKQISEGIRKLTTIEPKPLQNDLKPLSPSPVKRATSPTASSKAKEVAKGKVNSLTTRARPLTTVGTVKPGVARTSSVKTVTTKPSTTAVNRSTTLAPKTARPTVAPTRTGVTRSTLSSTTGKLSSTLPKSTVSNPPSRPISRTSPPSKSLTSTTAVSKPTTTTTRTNISVRKPLSATATTVTKLTTRPASSSTVTTRISSSKPASTVSTSSKSTVPLKSSFLSKSSASTSALKPVASKVDSGLSSLKTVRLNVPASSGLKSSSTSVLRSSSANPSVSRTTSVNAIKPTRPTMRVSPPKVAKKTVVDPKDPSKDQTKN